MSKFMGWPLELVFKRVYEEIKLKFKDFIYGGEVNFTTSFNKCCLLLDNVRIKTRALDALQMPIEVASSSKIKQVSLKMSYSAKSPKVKLEVSHLNLVLNPCKLKGWDKLRMQQFKFKKLREWEQNQTYSLNSQSNNKALIKWVLTNFAKRLHVSIKNVVVYYKDTESIQILGYPCLVRLHIEKIHISKTSSSSEGVHLHTEVFGVSLAMMCENLQRDSNIENFYNEVKLTEKSYVLKPLNLEVTVELNLDEAVHKVILEIKDQLALAINENQKFFVVGLSNLLSMKNSYKKYNFLRPHFSIETEPLKWWLYIINAGKFDKRANLLDIFNSKKRKKEYKDLYKRSQKIVHCPWLKPLSSKEEQSLRELEEILALEEIVNFRNQCIEELRKNASEKFFQVINPLESEQEKEVFAYFQNVYSDIVTDEHSEPTVTTQDPQISISAYVPKVLFFLQKATPNKLPKFKYTHQGCKCNACCKSKLKLVLRRTVSKIIEALPAMKKSEKTEKLSFKNMGPPRNSLIPQSKMREAATEYGEDFYTVETISFIQGNKKDLDSKFLSEETVLVVCVEDLGWKLESSAGNLCGNLNIGPINLYDPCSSTVCDSQNEFLRSSSIQPFSSKTKQYSILFCETENDLFIHHALRLFMAKINMLHELEFLLHFSEVKKAKKICMCKERSFGNLGELKSYFFGEEEKVHITPERKLQLENHLLDTLNVIAEEIKTFITKEVFPYFFRSCIRFFPGILPASKQAEKASLCFSKQQGTADFELDVSSVSFLLTDKCLSDLLAWAKSPAPKLLLKKHFFKGSFIKTLNAMPKNLSKLYSVLRNFSKSQENYYSKLLRKQLKKDKVTLSGRVGRINAYFLDFTNYNKYVCLPLLELSLSNIVVAKTLSGAFESAKDSKFSLEDSEIDPSLFEEFFVKVSFIELSVNKDSLVKASLNLKAFKSICENHPIFPKTLIDLHIPSVECLVNPQICILVGFLESLDFGSKEPFEEPLEGTQNYLESIYSLEKKKAHSLVSKYFGDHYYTQTPNKRCRHCLLAYSKTNSVVTLSLGNIQRGVGVCVKLENKQDLGQIQLSHGMVTLEERFFVLTAKGYIGEVTGFNSNSESVALSAGSKHSSVTPLVNKDFSPFLKNLFKKYLEIDPTQEINSCYKFLGFKKEINTEIFKDSEWGMPKKRTNLFISPPSSVSGTNSPQNNKLTVELRCFALTLKLSNSLSKFTKSLILVQKILESCKTLKKPKSKLSKLSSEQLSAKFYIEAVKFDVHLNERVLSVNLKEIELLKMASVFDFNSAKTDFSVQHKLTIQSINLDNFNLFTAKIENTTLFFSVIKEGTFIAQKNQLYFNQDKKKEVLKLQVAKVFVNKNTEELVFGIPCQNRVSCLKPLKSSLYPLQVQVNSDESSLVKIRANSVGLKLETKDITALNCLLEDLEIDKLLSKAKEELFDLKLNITHQKEQLENNSKLFLQLKNLHLYIDHKKNPIARLFLVNLLLHRNFAPESLLDVLEKETRNLLGPQHKALAHPFGKNCINGFVQNLKFIPIKTSFQNILELPDYSVSFSVNTLAKTVRAHLDSPKLILINRVVEELLQFAKNLKRSNKGEKSQPFEVVVNSLNTKVEIPAHSSATKSVVLTAEEAHLSVSRNFVEYDVPSALEPEPTLIKEKHIVHDEISHQVTLESNQVELALTKTVFSHSNEELQELGKAQNTVILINDPVENSELSELEWKIDTQVRIKLQGAEFEADLFKIAELEQTLNSNFDEELLYFEKKLKWQKLNLEVNIEEAELKLEAAEHPQTDDLESKPSKRTFRSYSVSCDSSVDLDQIEFKSN